MSDEKQNITEEAAEIPSDESVIPNEAEEPTDETPALTPEEALKEAEDIKLRALAEMENFKKRLQKEKDEHVRYAAEKVLADLLPSLDNLDLALKYGSQEEACRNTIMGVEMTRKLLLDALKKHGLERIGTVGEAFDPEIHEAMSHDENAGFAPGTVTEVLQMGYRLKERLLRPAKVKISK
ncbi:MAG: nucleotide exchange factor GrpE [Mailhella sp.]|nr:nucleotide exchange factor GrpE [Mailhella sp.]